MATKNSQTGPSQASTNWPRDPANRPRSDLTIVRIGASAGVLAPRRTFLAALPAQTCMTSVIMVHLAPDHESVLPDLLRQDPPFSEQDLVICRNVLIYIQRPLQERVFQTFRYALRPGGFLFLGSAEMTDEMGVVFKVLDKRHRLYRRQKCGRRMGD